MTLEKVLAILQKEPGEKIKLTVKREDHLRKFTFRLQSFFSALSYSWWLKFKKKRLKNMIFEELVIVAIK